MPANTTKITSKELVGPIQQMPELRHLIEAARRYVIGEIDVVQLWREARVCSELARERGMAAPIRVFCDDLLDAAERCWNEFGHVKNPLTDEQFKQILREQLG